MLKKIQQNQVMIMGVFMMTLSVNSNPVVASLYDSNSSTVIARDKITTDLASSGQNNSINKDEPTSAEVIKEASRWGLSFDDYSQYLKIMQSTPSGVWYKNLDPAEVLAIHAQSDAERERLAEIVVKTTHDRVEHELLEQSAYDKAWQKLYPDLKPIATPVPMKVLKKSGLEASDQLILFTTLELDESQTLSDLLTILQKNPSVTLAILAVGNQIKDTDIQDWAAKIKIPVELVQKKRVILDHDNNRFNQLTQGKGMLPAILLNHQGQFTTVTLNDLEG